MGEAFKFLIYGKYRLLGISNEWLYAFSLFDYDYYITEPGGLVFGRRAD